MNIRKIASIFVLLIPIPIALFWGNIIIQEQIKIIDLLITVSSIVFGVMGIWISILYPEAIKNKEFRTDYKVQSVFNPLVKATLMLVLCVVYKVSYPVLTQITFILRYKLIIRSASYLLILEISFQMLIAIVSVLVPANYFKNDISDKKSIDEQRDRIFRGRSKVGK
jgi:hypothetical protein